MSDLFYIDVWKLLSYVAGTYAIINGWIPDGYHRKIIELNESWGNLQCYCIV